MLKKSDECRLVASVIHFIQSSVSGLRTTEEFLGLRGNLNVT